MDFCKCDHKKKDHENIPYANHQYVKAPCSVCECEGFERDDFELPESVSVYGIYMRGLGDDRGFYAREAEEEGLRAVYKAGFNAGRTIVVEERN